MTPLKYILIPAIFILFACSKTKPVVAPIIDEKPIVVEVDDNTPPKAVSDYGQLSVAGNKILDKNGNQVQLRGMSLFWSQWIGKYYNEETVKWLKTDWQCNVIRAAMAVENGGYLTNKEAEKAKVYTVIDAAIKEGIYVIVDWHDHKGEDHLESAKEFFGEVAKKYGKYPNLIYETYNEPLNVSWKSVLKPYHEAVIAEIRKYDNKNLIICGTRNWSQNVDDVIGNKIADKNTAYTLHYYAATHKQGLRDVAKNALDNEIPLFVTEYGTTEASADGSINTDEATKWWAFLDQYKISHCNWSIADKMELAAALRPEASTQGGWSISDLTISGRMVRTEIRKKN
jgi:endoglucanase